MRQVGTQELPHDSSRCLVVLVSSRQHTVLRPEYHLRGNVKRLIWRYVRIAPVFYTGRTTIQIQNIWEVGGRVPEGRTTIVDSLRMILVCIKKQ